MKYKTTVIRNGGSLFALVPSIVRKNLDLKEGDEVEITVSEINKEKVPERYRCKLCGLLFETDDDIPYCPACDCEEVETMYEGIEIEGGHKYNGNISTSREH